MFNKPDQNYEIIKKASDMLYRFFDGQKMTHSDIVAQAEKILTIVLPNGKDLAEYYDILGAVIDLYEIEVGIKTYAPNVLSKDKKSKYWLYKVKPNIPHSFFDRYKLYLSKDGFAQKAIDNIESTCEEVLSQCANPKCITGYDQKRGLVMGDVQSGKTANYLGLINMAYDYGYRIVVLLAGTTNSLRLQTQKRTDKGVIGAKSDSIGNSIEYIGVGFDTKEHYVVPFTNQANDFAKFIQRNLNAGIGDFNKPVVLVVKKVKNILESVENRLQAALDEQGLDSKSILIIDDEADNASVNTARPGSDPSSINRCIRRIFNKFPIASYVGYTATPFANVFINPYDENDDDLDLFPADFIVQLNSSDNYFGGRRYFPKNADKLPRCLRLISEEEPCFLPVIHDKYTKYPALASSLKEAIHAFLINSVIRTLRGQPTKHRTIMINITRFNDVQEQIRERVVDYIELLSDAIEQLSSKSEEEFISNRRMKAIFDLFYSSFYKQIREGNAEHGFDPIGWADIQNGLYSEIKQVITVVINSKNGKMSRRDSDGKNKRFDYEDYEKTGARVIAIGGMVLSRGLTLEGLMISYYSRNAGAYDTLLQMCRWFGYRPKYEDLCRVYLSQENIDRFDSVLDAVEDLKDQFVEMERQGKKPKDFGLMIKESPDTLDTTMLITSRNKMRSTEVIIYHLNYGGVYADTSKLSRDPAINDHNLRMFERLYVNIHFSWEQNRYIAQRVPKNFIAELISSIKIPYINKKFDTEGLSEYIENSDMFLFWDVVIATGDSTNISSFMGVNKLTAVERSFHLKNSGDIYIRIGGTNNRVMEPGILNAGLWLDEQTRQFILQEKNTRTGKSHNELSATDYLQRRENPILVIYPIELKTTASEAEMEALPGQKEEIENQKRKIKESLGKSKVLLAFAIGFPQKESKVVVNYRANRIKLDELNRNIEIDDDGEGAEDNDD